MNLLYGEIIAISEEHGIMVGRVRVGGVIRSVPLELVASVACGDKVLVCDGVAISKVEEQCNDVSGDSGKVA